MNVVPANAGRLLVHRVAVEGALPAIEIRDGVLTVQDRHVWVILSAPRARRSHNHRML